MYLSIPSPARRTSTTLATLLTTIVVLSTAACGSSDPAADVPPTTTRPPATTQPEPTGDPSSEPDGEVVEYGPPQREIELTGDRTSPITAPLADGVYFSQAYTSADGTVTFTLTQYFLCDGSTNVPDAPTVVCASGFGTLDDPSATADLAPDATVTVATGDLDDPTRAAVSAAEFARLVAGETPGAGAPDDYSFSPFLVFVEVVDGVVVAGQQFYTS